MTPNPLRLLPAKARAVIYITAVIIAVIVPVIIPDLTGTWRTLVQGLAAVAALFASGQGLANLTSDEDNPAIQSNREPPPGGSPAR
ncbi:MAG: hypothetical protein LBV06_07220 [Propionibacteriaceae bacterium]|jgi:hypothetical protein|nr:hypothetical protein [Propionibacteriaceae bacterium]